VQRREPKSALCNKEHQSMATAQESDDDECLADMGFMFEGSEATTLKRFEWNRTESEEVFFELICLACCKKESEPVKKSVYAALNVVDKDPGAVQSGYYLWPAAPALVKHLLNEKSSVSSIVELGAGCALASIVALQLFSNTLECVIVTDHDPGTLQRARDNRTSTLEELQEKCGTAAVEKISSIPVFFESLSWGDKDGAERLLDLLTSTTHTKKGFEWILGSDLIYCREVVEPLIQTASLLLDKTMVSKFLLSQSFPYDDETEQEIDTSCNKLGLKRKILLDTLDQEGGVRIQKYFWK
jgi:predicted nicotinamide N-methyase